MSLTYNKKLIPLAKELRHNMTKQEKHLWYDFLCKYPIRFQRQKPIDNFIADFYCHKAKLVVELDGSQHYEPKEAASDAERTVQLGRLGIHVLRFPNNAVDRYFEGVCEAIDLTVQALMNGAPVPAFPVEAVMW